MPQIAAVFLTVFWVSMVLFGILPWYWGLAGWALTGAVLEYWFRRRRPAKPKEV